MEKTNKNEHSFEKAIETKRKTERSQKICIILPTRQRPEGFERALKSYLDNKCVPALNEIDYSDIYFAFQNPQEEFLQSNLNIARKYFPKMNNLWLVGDIGFINKINFMVAKYPDYGAYMILNDDQIIQTKDFDKILMDKLSELEKESGHRLHILHWKDGIHDEKLCQSFCTDEMLKVLGTYYPKGYMRHLYSDNMYHFIGTQCGILNYVPEVFIEHLHFVNNKAEMDSSYQATNSQQAYDSDGNAFGEWLQHHAMNTCKAILTITEKDEKVIAEKLKLAETEMMTMFEKPEEKITEKVEVVK